MADLILHSLSRRLARWLIPLGLLLFPALARADAGALRFTEILLDPAGPNGGAQWVELMNTGAEPVDLGGIWIGAEGGPAVRLVAGAPVAPGGFVVVLWNWKRDGGAAAGPSPGNGSQEVATGAVPGLDPVRGRLILSRSSSLLDPAAMIAYLPWGAPGQSGSDAAGARGLWPPEQALPRAAEGHSLALAPGGSPRSAAGWFTAAAPTPGAVNTGPVSAWQGWRLVGTAAMTPAASGDLGGDLLDAIGVSPLGVPVHYRFRDGAWSPGLPLAATTLLPVALTGDRTGRLDLALTDPNGEIWHWRFVDGQWRSPVSLGRGLLQPPALAYNPAAKELELVAADPSGALQFTRAVDAEWSPWMPVGAAVGAVPPALAINELDRPFDLVYAGLDGRVRSRHFAAGVWGPSATSDGFTALRPAVAVTGAGTVEVVVTAPDGGVYHNEVNDGFWGVWRWTGLSSRAAPALLSSPAEYGLELVVADPEGRLLHSRLVNGVWGRPWPLGAVSDQPAAITAGPDGGLELLAAGADGSLWHNRFRPGAPELVSLSRRVQSIFDVYCIQCHDTGDPQAEQNLEPDAAYFSLVNVSSTQVPRMRRIQPGDPDASYLIHKISGTHEQVGGTGDRMPAGGRLSDDEIRTIREWIEQGALNN